MELEAGVRIEIAANKYLLTPPDSKKLQYSIQTPKQNFSKLISLFPYIFFPHFRISPTPTASDKLGLKAGLKAGIEAGKGAETGSESSATESSKAGGSIAQAQIASMVVSLTGPNRNGLVS
jgi:hypothetical protein